MQAKTREQFVKSWNSHIAEFSSVILGGKVPVSDWLEIEKTLKHYVQMAATEDFGEPDPEQQQIFTGCSYGVLHAR